MIKAVLTIDDIPSSDTESLVDYLNEKGIRALMFAWGEHAKANPGKVIYALQHGMIVGNHSYSHPAFEKLTYEECINEIERCEEVLDAIYAEAGVERRFKPFRFPYGNKGGDKKDRLEKYLAENGFSKLDDTNISYPWWKEYGLDKDIDTFWTFDFAEYQIRPDSGFTLDDVWKRVHDNNPPSGGALLEDGSFHIILMHDHDETREMVPEYYKLMIGHIMECGVTFVDPCFIK